MILFTLVPCETRFLKSRASLLQNPKMHFDQNYCELLAPGTSLQWTCGPLKFQKDSANQANEKGIKWTVPPTDDVGYVGRMSSRSNVQIWWHKNRRCQLDVIYINNAVICINASSVKSENIQNHPLFGKNKRTLSMKTQWDVGTKNKQ